MTDITGLAIAYWNSLRLTTEQREDKTLRNLVIEAFEQGYMQHQVH